MAEMAIEVTNLSKSYGTFVAIEDVSFAIPSGEICALLGPNGAGKTSCVEILEGYRSRDSGVVSVLGSDPKASSRRWRERIGIVLQETGLQFQLSVSEAIAMYGSYYSKQIPTSELVEIVGLDAKSSTRVGDLSGGQRRRLDLALALVGDPDLIFLDEPTTGFDPGARQRAWETIASLGKLGKTILLTTHYMEEAQTLASHIVVMKSGVVVADSTPEALGGRDREETRIRFRWSNPKELRCPTASGDTLGWEGEYVTIHSPNPTATFVSLCAFAEANHLSLESLTVSQPSLEDTYLRLTASDGIDHQPSIEARTSQGSRSGR